MKQSACIRVLIFLLIVAGAYGYLFRQPNSSNCNGKLLSTGLTEIRNKRIVKSFYQDVFGDLNVDASDKYIQDPYIQHNPYVADGKDAFKTFARKLFEGRTPSEINFWRTAADGDLVWVHTGYVQNNTVRGVVDIFRLQNYKIVEHWDVMQNANEPFANSHPMN